MTNMEGNRCFGRLKAHELSEEETSLVGGGFDEIHSGYCARSVNGETGGDPDHVGCVYT